MSKKTELLLNDISSLIFLFASATCIFRTDRTMRTNENEKYEWFCTSVDNDVKCKQLRQVDNASTALIKIKIAQ